MKHIGIIKNRLFGEKIRKFYLKNIKYALNKWKEKKKQKIGRKIIFTYGKTQILSKLMCKFNASSKKLLTGFLMNVTN